MPNPIPTPAASTQTYHQTFSEICQRVLYHRGIAGRELRVNPRVTSVLRPSPLPVGYADSFAVLVLDDGLPWQAETEHEFLVRVLTGVRSDNTEQFILPTTPALILPGTTLPTAAIAYETVSPTRGEAPLLARRFLADYQPFLKLRRRFAYGVAHP